jgi:beta-glucosidase
MKTKNIMLVLAGLSLSVLQLHAQKKNTATDTGNAAAFVTQLLGRMTLKEKIGQLNQLAGNYTVTDPLLHKQIDIYGLIRDGKVGALLNVVGVPAIRKMQEAAVNESRLRIPLIFGFDVIHGFKTIFPIPLAESCSWDLEAMRLSARIAASESAASGLNWTFAPMVDICRDARWGRIAEGAGEDPYYGALVAEARVRGFQGDGLGSPDAIMACAKHFVGYGAAEGGRDYNGADLSDRQLEEIYFPPFKAAIKAQVATFMTAFNTINGVPATANGPLLRGKLKGEWKFGGFVVSDANSIGELTGHGVAADKAEAALLALKAGCDMDMVSNCYSNTLETQVKLNKQLLAYINDAVTRILLMKYKLGLFKDPYRFCNEAREKATVMNSTFLNSAREVARKSIVLLKNEHQLLPLSKKQRSIAVIGPLVASKRDMLGNWYAAGDTTKARTILDGIKEKADANTVIYYEKGCDINASGPEDFSAAVAVAQKADVIVLCLGEAGNMSGEAKSRSNIGLPGNQLALSNAMVATGKPVVVILSNGRPLDITELSLKVPAILETWFLGTTAGDAIADVLFGDYEPVGRLSVTFPYHVGHLPLYYAQLSTGRANTANPVYRSRYLDVPNTGLYPFGYGLSYTTFAYGVPKLAKDIVSLTDTINISVEVSNIGNRNSEEVVQLYLHDVVASVSRPVKELKRFRKIAIAAGKTATVSFTLTAEDLKYFDQHSRWVVDKGKFEVMVGPNSRDLQKVSFTLR